MDVLAAIRSCFGVVAVAALHGVEAESRFDVATICKKFSSANPARYPSNSMLWTKQLIKADLLLYLHFLDLPLKEKNAGPRHVLSESLGSNLSWAPLQDSYLLIFPVFVDDPDSEIRSPSTVPGVQRLGMKVT